MRLFTFIFYLSLSYPMSFGHDISTLVEHCLARTRNLGSPWAYITPENRIRFGAPPGEGNSNLRYQNYIQNLTRFMNSTDPHIRESTRNYDGWSYTTRLNAETREFLIYMRRLGPSGPQGEARPLAYLTIQPENIGFANLTEFANWALDPRSRFFRFSYQPFELVGFPNTDLRDEHFNKHGIRATEFTHPFSTPQEYELAGLSFVRRHHPATLTIVRGRFTFYYHPFTGETAIVEYRPETGHSFLMSYYINFSAINQSGMERFLVLHRRTDTLSQPQLPNE